MADAPVSWSRNSTVFSVDPNEKLFVFGYSCKIFRDDEKAKYIDQGKHLIPWMGDKTLMIDRYDVRGYLHDLKQYEPKAESCEDPLAEEELQCDEERYRSLRSDMSEEQLYHEEELKRLRAAIAGDGAYHEIAFTYGSAENQNYEEQEASKVEEPEDELFEIPQGLNVPKDMELPYTMKIHAIIEKTANFVSQQGGQMEIIIKMKQHANPQFAFMHLDNPLHPYYKHLVKEIKSGAYKPVQVKKVIQSEDEDDDGHYLHPSLMAGKAESVPKFTVPAINFRRSHDDSYSVLVRNLKQHIEETPPESATPPNEIAESESNFLNNVGSNSNSVNNSQNSIVRPPPDFQPVVDKMAEYVAKNGDDFEIIVKSRKDKRFDFLHSWHEFYNYYIHKRNLAKAMLSGNTPSPSQESTTPCGPSLENVVTQGCQPQPKLQQDITMNPKKDDITKEDFDALYEDDKDSVDSLDFLNSPKDENDSKSKVKKTTKALKGPISFSLKFRDTDAPPDKPTATVLLLDDSDEESGGENITNPNKRKKSLEMSQRTNMLEGEAKVPKNNELLEAKHAEERMRDKLLATARERMAQQRKEKQMEIDRIKREEQQRKDKILQLDAQRKEKQLQAERKRKAELFLKMLKKKTPDSTAIVSHILGSEKPGPLLQSKKRRRLSSTTQPIPGIKTDWSSDSASEHSGEEEPISVIGEQLSSDNESQEKKKEPAPSNSLTTQFDESKNHSKNNQKQKKKKSRHRSSSRSMSRSNSRSKSKTPPSRYREEKKEKKLPAAYALNRRSRSRSRSPPPRYKPFYNNYNHNTWYRRR